MRPSRLFVLMTMLLPVAACAHAPVAVDVERAELMPESAARRVVEKYFGPGWLARPEFKTGCFQNTDVSLPVSRIRGAVYYPDVQALVLVDRQDVVASCDLV